MVVTHKISEEMYEADYNIEAGGLEKFVENIVDEQKNEKRDEITGLTEREFQEYSDNLKQVDDLLELLRRDRCPYYLSVKSFVEMLKKSLDKPFIEVERQCDFNPDSVIKNRFPCLNRWHPLYVKSIVAKFCRLREAKEGSPMTFFTLSTAQGGDFSLKLRGKETSFDESMQILKAGWNKVRKLLHKYIDDLDYISVVERMDGSIFGHLHIIIFSAVPLWLQAKIKYHWEVVYKIGISTKGCWFGYEDKKKRDSSYIYKTKIEKGNFSGEGWYYDNWHLAKKYKWYSHKVEGGYEYNEGDGFDLSSGTFIENLVNYVVEYLSKSLISTGSKFKEKSTFKWTKEDLIFNAMLHKHGFRRFSGTRRVIAIMKRKDGLREISDPEFEVDDLCEGFLRDHTFVDKVYCVNSKTGIKKETFDKKESIEKTLRELVGMGSDPSYDEIAGELWDISGTVDRTYKKLHEYDGKTVGFAVGNCVVLLLGNYSLSPNANSESSLGKNIFPGCVAVKKGKLWTTFSYAEFGELREFIQENREFLDEMVEAEKKHSKFEG